MGGAGGGVGGWGRWWLSAIPFENSYGLGWKCS